VGTASSVLRGIEIPAGDIDILFRDRAGVDAWFEALSVDLDVETAPVWMADARQYFARVDAHGVGVELSTVELETDSDTEECYGSGPWQHFDVVAWGDGSVSAGATELRLITEVARAREGRYRPIIELLRAEGCDVDLIRRGHEYRGVSLEVLHRVLAELLPEGRRCLPGPSPDR
jgi:hypothetical protein